MRRVNSAFFFFSNILHPNTIPASLSFSFPFISHSYHVPASLPLFPVIFSSIIIPTSFLSHLLLSFIPVLSQHPFLFLSHPNTFPVFFPPHFQSYTNNPFSLLSFPILTLTTASFPLPSIPSIPLSLYNPSLLLLLPTFNLYL